MTLKNNTPIIINLIFYVISQLFHQWSFAIITRLLRIIYFTGSYLYLLNSLRSTKSLSLFIIIKYVFISNCLLCTTIVLCMIYRNKQYDTITAQKLIAMINEVFFTKCSNFTYHGFSPQRYWNNGLNKLYHEYTQMNLLMAVHLIKLVWEIALIYTNVQWWKNNWLLYYIIALEINRKWE